MPDAAWSTHPLAKALARAKVVATARTTHPVVVCAAEAQTRTAAQIMVPRAGIAAVSEDTTVDDFLRLAEQAHFTRFPVYRPDDKRFSGIVNLYDVLANQPADGAARISGFMRPPQFIRDITPLTDILPRMRMCRMPMCLVTNAGSEVTGLITTQSIVEEIVGRQ